MFGGLLAVEYSPPITLYSEDAPEEDTNLQQRVDLHPLHLKASQGPAWHCSTVNPTKSTRASSGNSWQIWPRSNILAVSSPRISCDIDIYPRCAYSLHSARDIIAKLPSWTIITSNRLVGVVPSMFDFDISFMQGVLIDARGGNCIF